MPKDRKKPYKLLSADKRQPCAFFASDKGCKNGENCTFSHEQSSKKFEMPPKKDQKASPRMKQKVEGGAVSVTSTGANSESSGRKVKIALLSKKKMKQEEVSEDEFPFETPDGKVQAQRIKKQRKQRELEFEEYRPKPGSTKKTKIESRDEGTYESKKYNRREIIFEERGISHKLRPAKKTKIEESQEPGTTCESKKQDERKKTSNNRPASGESTGKKADFRSLNLPVRKLNQDSGLHSSIKAIKKEMKEEAESSSDSSSESESSSKSSSESESEPKPEPKIKEHKQELMPLPTLHATGRKWLDAVKASRQNPRFVFDFGKLKETCNNNKHGWVKAKKFSQESCSDLPQVIVIDCEMCETQDPLSQEKDLAALCRLVVMDAETKEILLDTLVKPAWPVTDARTEITGITADDLKVVEFTLRHAQAFLMALCSDQTVMIGHSLCHDLTALRMDHSCLADTSYLFRAEDSELFAAVSLRDLVRSVLEQELPTTRDIVTNAKTALQCAEHWLDNKGDVKPVKRTKRKSADPVDHMLFVHHIPEGINEEHISAMFRKYTCIEPDKVDTIHAGRTRAHFKSVEHANLTFNTLGGEAELDRGSRPQKVIFLKKGKQSYIYVRKMI